ncbi:MAG: serine/threonine protein kinase [Phycisphaerales bacterium]|nr:serine/threonine protein kinase [Phycisphaerales bacterium]
MSAESDRTIDQPAPGRPPSATAGAAAGEVTAAPVPRSGIVAAPFRPAISVIGNYRIEKLLGEGGFGVVYLAEQTEPVRRRVALKLLKSGMDSEAVVARFEAERQALALMDHPSVSKVLDAGVTADGRPYFVMEFVQGETLLKFADSQRLDIRGRIVLFMQVCDGVQHAHSKGVLHRDLKPANILIAPEGTGYRAKVIDFGIAKALHQGALGDVEQTVVGQFLGTPAYMSPEQASAGSRDVDTRSDVYSLGVVLYELLTGSLPFDPESLRKATLGELQKMICESEPPRPSTRLGSLPTAGDTTIRSIANSRRIEPKTLMGQLRGDLDWVIMKCLDKDRERRYPSASELAADLQRFLVQEPVTAGPPSAVYRARKFVTRHRTGVSAAALISMMLVASSISLLFLYQKARTEQLRSERTLETFVGALRSADLESGSSGPKATMRDFLDTVQGSLRDNLSEEPDLAASVQETVGLVQMTFHDFAQALANLNSAVAARRVSADASGDDDERLALAASLHLLGRALFFERRFEESRKAYAESLEIKRALIVGDAVVTSDTLLHLSYLENILGREEESRVLYQESLAMRERLFGAESEQVASALNSRASAIVRHHPEEAAKLYLQSSAIIRAKLGPNDWRIGRIVGSLGRIQMQMGQTAAALSNFDQALALLEPKFGEEHLTVAQAKVELADALLRNEGDATRALALARQSARVRARDKPELEAASLEVAARACERLDDIPGALKARSDALQSLRHEFPGGGREVARACLAYSKGLIDAGRGSEAAPLLREASATFATLNDEPSRASSEALLAQLESK